MKQLLCSYLTGLERSMPQSAGELRIVPLLSTTTHHHDYLSLSRALREEKVAISEVNESGSVPNVRVINDSEKEILLLDGDEIKGAKQNRILNTTILVPRKSRLIIPVSCSEAGRWDFSTRLFTESEGFVSASMRNSKMSRVSSNLDQNRGFDASQSEVWREISELSTRHRAFSRTRAMSDVYEHRKHHLDNIQGYFPCLEGQCGIYVEIGGRFAGLDAVCSPEIWQDIHAKVIRSYAIEMDDIKPHKAITGEIDPGALFTAVLNAELIARNSVGLGEDIRIRGNDINGSALYHEGDFVHVAIFPGQSC